MRIRKKTSKSVSLKPPLFLIGYSFTPPVLDELRMWFDMQYGGPLLTKAEGVTGIWSATHGPWSARLRLSAAPEEQELLNRQATWDHQSVATVSLAHTGQSMVVDSVLHAARLARGLTLLTQGTTLDLSNQVYLNPSDWNDRPLIHFRIADHIHINQEDSHDQRLEWFYTLGLSKFSLDELEVTRPRGLPAEEAIEVLSYAAGQVVASGRNPPVDSTLDLPALARTATIIRHRTAAPAGRMVAFRELSF